MMMMRLRYRIATFALSSLCWSSRTCLLVRSFPLDLFNIVLGANSHADFDNDDYAFKFAVKWQTLRISSTTAAPFVGCADYAEGRHARIRLQRMFGVDAVRTVHHSREHGSSCFVFHAIHEEARALLGEGGGMAGGRGQLQHVIAFPANLKIAPNVLDFSAGLESSTGTASHEVYRAANRATNNGTARRLSGKSSGRHDLRNIGSKMSASERMHSDMLAEQKKARFYSTSSKASNKAKAKDTRPRKVGTIGSEFSLRQSPRVHSASPWESEPQKLRVKPHEDMHFLRARGLGIQLSPGALAPPQHHVSGTSSQKNAKENLPSEDNKAQFDELVETWKDSWTSLGHTELHRLNIWSDPDANFQVGAGGAGASANKAFRSAEWRLAADKLEQMMMDLSTEGGLGAGCGWNAAVFTRETSDFISVTGIDGLLNGPHLQEESDEKSTETEDWRVACFMGLLSVFASTHQVLRISPLPRARTHNAVASAITESGTITREPFRHIGLDGSGEVVQVVDTGLDELSCFFVDDTGAVQHSTMDNPITDLARRKVVQYVEYPSGDGFDGEPGHGTHVASSIAGDVYDGWQPSDCPEGEQVDCFGVCADAEDVTSKAADSEWDMNLYCEDLSCDGGWLDYQSSLTCLKGGSSDAPLNGGVARGAKIAFFDVSGEEDATVLDVPYPDAREAWQTAENTGAAIHSNSWGYYGCVVGDSTYYNDQYLYENPKHLLVFAAGNKGDSSTDLCSITTPATGKNSLAVGSSKSGITRFSVGSTIDEVSGFSGRGPLADGRIKPDVVAPGDMVISARSAGYSGEQTCQLDVRDGTSMSTPIVAGALAIVRQYFRQGWYTADVTARGLCDGGEFFNCMQTGNFDPSGALLKAVLVHGADEMGGSSSPDGIRGFGRVLLEGSLPVGGEGSTTMYFDDSAVALAGTTTNYVVTVADLTVELKATLVWMDPPVLTFVGRQLLHDLDLVVLSSNGDPPMYANGESECCDAVNNAERVVVPVSSSPTIGTREYTVQVIANELVEDDQQAYSLIISGGYLNVTSVTTRETFDESSINATNQPTPTPTSSPTDAPQDPPRLSVDGYLANNCTDSDLYNWIGDGWCDASMNNQECYFDGGDCCADTCVDNTFTCGVSGYVCEDSASPSKSFCNQTKGSDVAVGTDSTSPTEWDLGGNSAGVGNETRAHVCENCDPEMKDFFYTIGDGICDDWSNVASCAFDGGDCCQDTCAHAECQKATALTCFDPWSNTSFCGTIDPADTDYDYHATLCRECPAFASDLGSFIGDGFCDSFVAFNSPECFFDGGDCCIDTCKEERWTCPEENSEGAYVCLDPASSSYLCKHLADETGGIQSICETCAAHMGPAERFQIGDGICDIDMNVEGCLWDAGTRLCSEFCLPWSFVSFCF
eukprot:jgi/Undpi1/8559/HiC_scaffold_25.g11024.m1